MNDLVEIIGSSISPTTKTFCAFSWQQGQMTELPSPAGSPAVLGIADNLLGQVVGTTQGPSPTAFLWQNGTTINLNSQIAPSDPLEPYVRLQAGRLINNLGDIVATGVDSRNPNIAQWYLLTPVR